MASYPINTEVLDRDFFLGCSMGLVPFTQVVNVFGRNPDVDTTPEDVWAQGGDWVAPTAARVMNIVSTSTNDTAAGTGARTVVISGLNASYNQQSETVVLNGLTDVPAVGSYTFVSKMTTATAGSTGSNVGAITATAVTDATVQCNMQATFNTTQLGWYMIPAGYTGYLLQFGCGVQQATASAGADVIMLQKNFGGVYTLIDTLALYTGGSSHAHHQYCLPRQLPEKSIIKTRVANATNANNDVHVTMGILLVKNEPEAQ